MVISTLTKKVCELIQNSDNPQFEAGLIVMSAAGMDRTQYVLNKNSDVNDNAVTDALKMAERRGKGEPLAYILGSTEFMGLTFFLNPDTLIPRADTETLVEYLIDYILDKPLRVLDIGTGTGCIGISVGHFCKNADITLLDISENALCIAKENANLNTVPVKTVKCDILSDIPKDRFDVIVSNPPYIRSDVIDTLQTEVKDYEPHRALDGGGDGLVFYRRIARIARQMLNSGGLLAFEIGYDQGKALKEIMADYSDVRVIKDLCGNDRIASGILK